MKHKVRIVLALACATVVLTSEVKPRAYTAYSAWAQRPIQMYVNPNNNDVTAAAAEAAVQAAMGYWNAQSAGLFSYAGRVSDTTMSNDGRSVIVFRNASDGSAVGATYTWSWNGDLIEADVVFWDGGFTFFTGSTGCSGGIYVEDVATHELGHAIGLGHSDQPDAAMYPSTGWCSQEWRTLSSDDIAGLRSLYPTGGQTQTPDAPSNLAVTGVTTASIALSWTDGSSNETGFKVERSSDGAAFATVAQLGSNVRTYTNTGLASGTGYYYRVIAYNSGGSSAASNVASAVTASAANTAPVVTISNPVNGAVYQYGFSVTLSGTATDSQDGSLTSSLVWTSSIDGNLGTGGSLSKTLSAGSHTITARVTDSGGLSGSKPVSMTVSAPASGPMTLSARGYKVRTAAKADLTWSGASTGSVDVYRNNAKVTSTPNDGLYTDSPNKKAGTNLSYKVCNAGTQTCTNLVSVTF